jgi:hypothetical protein
MKRAVRWLINTGGKVCMGAVFLALGTLMSAAAVAGAITCSPSKVKAVTSDAFRSTMSTVFVRLTETGGRFIQGGTKASCVMVRFEGYVATDVDNVLTISATIDGQPIGERQLAYAAAVYQPRAWTFIVPNVAPGLHVIRFVFRTNNGKAVSVSSTNTIIHHAP